MFNFLGKISLITFLYIIGAILSDDSGDPFFMGWFGGSATMTLLEIIDKLGVG